VGEAPIFYYDTNSPYAYLAAERIQDVITEAEWRPIAFGMLLRDIDRVPWSLRPGREEQMADCERRAAERGLPPITWPKGWPAQTWSLAPLRAQIMAEEQGLLVPFALACYRKMFVEARSLAELNTIFDAARVAGLDPPEVRDRIAEPALKERLREYTDEATARGVVGVPTVAVGDELFWGDDRLEDAAAALARAG
jgi:2-hydroxychromene-2-carboxylate isomerase